MIHPTHCALCKKQAMLVESHILPAFVFRWKKKTSATGYLRSNKNPNKRVQDGLTVQMLCIQCEALFNGFETPFSRHVFHPFVSGKTATAPYGPWLLKFCVSVSWRILSFSHRGDGLANWSDHHQARAKAALEGWGAFLLGQKEHPGEFSQHLLPLGSVESTTANDVPSNINRYLLRGVEINIAHASVGAFTYAKNGTVLLIWND